MEYHSQVQFVPGEDGETVRVDDWPQETVGKEALIPDGAVQLEFV